MQEEKKVNSKGEQNSDSGSKKSIVGNRRRRKKGGCGCGKKRKQA